MNLSALELSILLPAFVAGALVVISHVPLGIQVLARGIVFIDLAIAQIAGVGVIVAALAGLEPEGWAVQVPALLAALAGALILTWTERRHPEVQEPVIGVAFVLAATGAIILLAGNVHGGEHLRDLLVGQILWVRPDRLIATALFYALILLIWFRFRQRIGRVGFYLLFACTVTLSVQLVGLYLVFASLIIPPLATRRLARGRLALGYGVGIVGYAVGLAVSVGFDLPTGPVIVWALAAVGLMVGRVIARRMPRHSRP